MAGLPFFLRIIIANDPQSYPSNIFGISEGERHGADLVGEGE